MAHWARCSPLARDERCGERDRAPRGLRVGVCVLARVLASARSRTGAVSRGRSTARLAQPPRV